WHTAKSSPRYTDEPAHGPGRTGTPHRALPSSPECLARMTNMDVLRSSRSVRLRLEALEDRLAPSISPVFNNIPVANSATTNTTTNRTTPAVGVAADNSF